MLERASSGEAQAAGDLAAAVCVLMKGLAPFVLVLEDMHETGANLREVSAQLAAAVQRTRGLALITTDREPPSPPFVASQLEPLSPEELTALLNDEAGGSLPADASGFVLERAAGNPLYALEYLRLLTRRGHLWSDGRTWRWRRPELEVMPGSVEALVEQRLRQARDGDDDRVLLGAVALLGDRASLDLVAATCGLSTPAAARSAARLSAAGVLISEGDSIGFATAVYSDVSRRSLSEAEQRELAGRAVGALAPQPLAAARLVKVAGLRDERALDVLEAAAAASADPLTAARWRADASRLATGERRARLALAAAQVLQHHDLNETRRLLEVAVEHPATEAEAFRFHVQLLALNGRQAEADELAMRMPSGLRERVPPAALLLSSRHVAGDPLGAWRVWEEHAELRELASPEVWRAAAGAALATGRVAEAGELVERGLIGSDDPAMRAEFLSLKALMAYHAGDAAAAVAHIGEALALLQALDAPRLRATALLNKAAFLRASGDYQAMGECLEESLAIRQDGGDGRAYAFAKAGLAGLRTEQGRYEVAEDLLTDAIATLELYGPSRYLTAARSIAAALGSAQGTPLARLTGLRQAELAVAEARQAGNARLLREILIDAALAHAYDGRSERALELVAESRSLAEAAGASPADAYRELWAEGLAYRGLDRLPEAEEVLERGLALARATEGAVDTNKVGLHLAHARTDLAAARAHHAWFVERGLGHGAALAESLFPELGGSGAAGGSSSGRAEAVDQELTLEVLGPMRLTRSSGSMSLGGPAGFGRSEGVRGQKRQLLLAALLEARVGGREGVSKLELLDLLYPGEDETSAGGSLKALVHVLRKAYGNGLVLSTTEGYALGGCGSDLERFLMNQEGALWRGHYLGGLDTDGSVRAAAYQVLADVAERLLKVDPREAARLTSLLYEGEPYRLDYLALHLQALLEAGDHGVAERRYLAARSEITELGAELPSRWQDFLADEGLHRPAHSGSLPA